MIQVAYVLDPRYEGGAERYVLRLSQNIDRSSFEPIWILPARRDLDRLAGKAEAASIQVIRHAPANLGGAIGKVRPHVVHLNMPSSYDLSCGAAALVARTSGARHVVATEHIVDIPPSRRRGLLKRVAARWIDRIIAISGAHREILVHRHGLPESRIEVIHNGVEDPGRRPERPEGGVRIVCVGSLEERKGQELLVRAFAGLRRHGASRELVLVGDGPLRPRLEAIVKEEDLSPSVAFTGEVPSAWSELLRSDIAVVPSLREGIPFTVLEAMAAGAAIIVSRLPGLDEVIEHERTGWLVSPGDIAELTRALERLAGDGELRRSLAKAARAEYERRFTLAAMVRRTEALYRTVVG
jgi:glycosyltransferase involved in cell wall biosynthesis